MMRLVLIALAIVHAESAINRGVTGDRLVDYNDYAYNVTGNHEPELARVLDGFVVLTNVYDTLVRPGQFDKRSPTTVVVDAVVHPWVVVDRNILSVTLTVVQNWTDARLAYRHRVAGDTIPFVTLTSHLHLVEVWMPDTWVANSVEAASDPLSDVVRISPDGDASREMTISVAVSCPADRDRVCPVVFTSFSWDSDNVVYEWAHDNQVDPTPDTRVTALAYHHVLMPRREFGLGHSSALVLEFHVTGHYPGVLFYGPMGIFCLACVVSIGRTEVVYAMFAFMSLFFGVWASRGNAGGDYYFVGCVATAVASGIFSVIAAKIDSVKTGQDAYEMRNAQNDSDGDLATARPLPVAHSLLIKLRSKIVAVMAGVFVTWNVVYWIKA